MKFSVEFDNCYGIKRLKHDFVFGDKPIIVHAPNGTFKTSFCKTINDFCNGVTPKNYVSQTPGLASVLIDDKKPSSDRFNIYNGDTSKYNDIVEKSNALLLNQDLRNELQTAKEPYKSYLDSLLNAIRTESGFKNESDLVSELLITYNLSSEDKLIDYLHKYLSRFSPFSFELEKYSIYFTSDIEKIVQLNETKSLINKYDRLCNKAAKKIKYIENGIFDIQDFIEIATLLNNKNYFSPGNSIKLVGKKEIKNKTDLNKVIEEINKLISSDAKVSTNFKALQNSFKNKRGGSKLLNNIKKNHLIAYYYCNYSNFKKRYFSSLFKKHYSDVFKVYELKKVYCKKLSSITKRAIKDRTIWGKTIETFNSRFNNKYTLEIDNKSEAVLGVAKASLLFKYKDNNIDYIVEMADLYDKILSEGEKRAFLLLDIIFDIEKFKLERTKKLLIFDDIADSLDYTNKHCIIEYLKEIADDDLFDVLVLTHNFDFYRHFGKKVSVNYSNAMFAENDGNGIITIENGGYLNNLFLYLKEQAEKSSNMNIALSLIPFARTNVENGYKNSAECSKDFKYIKYTKLLHYRPNGGSNITGNSLYKLYYDDFKVKINCLEGNSTRIYRIIYNQAKLISSSTDINQRIEEKIVLSMALRIFGEKYMYNKLKQRKHLLPSSFCFDKSEFGQTFSEFKNIYKDKVNEINVLDCISILTPMEIHINGFAYEPLIDYSITRLRTLFKELISFVPYSILYN